LGDLGLAEGLGWAYLHWHRGWVSVHAGRCIFYVMCMVTGLVTTSSPTLSPTWPGTSVIVGRSSPGERSEQQERVRGPMADPRFGFQGRPVLGERIEKPQASPPPHFANTEKTIAMSMPHHPHMHAFVNHVRTRRACTLKPGQTGGMHKRMFTLSAQCSHPQSMYSEIWTDWSDSFRKVPALTLHGRMRACTRTHACSHCERATFTPAGHVLGVLDRLVGQLAAGADAGAAERGLQGVNGVGGGGGMGE
jgi:hypothetical protein